MGFAEILSSGDAIIGDVVEQDLIEKMIISEGVLRTFRRSQYPRLSLRRATGRLRRELRWWGELRSARRPGELYRLSVKDRYEVTLRGPREEPEAVYISVKRGAPRRPGRSRHRSRRRSRR